MMQQNSYRNERYTRWLKTSGDTTSWQRLAALCVLLISMSPFASSIVSFGIIAAFALGSFIYLATRKYKKPLVWTQRAKRIYSVGIIISALLALAITLCSQSSGIYSLLYVICLTFLGLYCGSHIIIMVERMASFSHRTPYKQWVQERCRANPFINARTDRNRNNRQLW